MSKNGWGTVLVSVVVLLFAGYVYVFEFKKGEDNEKKKDLDAVLLNGVAADKVTHIEWWTGPNKTVFVDKKDGVWTLTAPRPMDHPDQPLKDRASTEEIDRLLQKILQARATETVVEGQFDEKTFGLDRPMYELKLSQTPGNKSETTFRGLRIGSVKAYDASLYAQIDEEKAVRLAPNGLLELFKKTPNELRERSLYRGSASAKWRTVTVEKSGKVVLALKLKNGAWAAGNDLKLKPDAAAVEAYIKRLEGVRAIDFIYDGPSAGVPARELKLFKLDHPYLLVRLKDDAGKIWDMRLTNAKDAAAEAPQGAMQASVNATSSDFPAVAKVLDQNLKIIDKRAEDFERRATPTPTPNPSAAASPKGQS